MSENKTNIVEKLRKGDHQAFDSIFREYFHKLYNFSLSYVNDSEVAKELVQETFSKLWGMRKELIPGTRISALLFTIIRNQSLNYLKQIINHKKFVEEKSLELYSAQLNYKALKDESAELILLRELEGKIEIAIDSLTERTREVFLLSRNKGLKYKEIADKLNISIKTVETHITHCHAHQPISRNIRRKANQCQALYWSRIFTPNYGRSLGSSVYETYYRNR